MTTFADGAADAFPVKRVCGGYGFGQFDDTRPTRVLLDLVRKRLRVLDALKDPTLEERRRACLQELNRLEKNLTAPTR